jgi:glycine/D-amino acid oxidase-like deaminating enzyme/nitrite reductase/ring-hydroxylating ferredoxin subunit
MKSNLDQSISIWADTAETPTQKSSFTKNVHADVCIVGAGIAGISTAYFLSREGKAVIVLDDGPIGGGETARTTAHLTTALDYRYYELESLHGKEGARLSAESHSAAINTIETIVGREGIDCEFERLDGYLFVPLGESQTVLDDELEAAHKAGLTEIEKVDRVPWDSYQTGPALRFPDQAQFHPLKYLSGLTQAIRLQGGRIYTQVRVTEIEGGRQPRIATNAGAEVIADAVVVATHTPVNDRIVMHIKQAPYQTYVIGARVPLGSVRRGLYWDTLEPYHYVRVETVGNDANAYDVLIIGGEDHKTGQDNDAPNRFAALEQWARHRFPMIETIEYRWSGEVLLPIDGLAFIGASPVGERNVFIATGSSGNGMTYGTIAGILLTDLLAGRRNDWTSLYNPSRVTFQSLPTFTEQLLNVSSQYTDLLVGGDVKSVDEIPPGAGAVISRGVGKVAVYRDPAGEIHERSAICTHLGCVVQWNSFENSWDCPCHGSRFGAMGKVIHGPASTDLAEE